MGGYKRFTLAAASALVILTLVSGALAGQGWKGKARTQMAGVPCEATEVAETETSENLKQLARQPWSPAIETGEVEVGNGLLLSSFFSDPPGFVVTDVSNPLKPRVLS